MIKQIILTIVKIVMTDHNNDDDDDGDIIY